MIQSAYILCQLGLGARWVPAVKEWLGRPPLIGDRSASWAPVTKQRLGRLNYRYYTTVEPDSGACWASDI